MDQKEELLRRALDALYGEYHQRRYVHPDPLEFLYRYDEAADREIVALVAASLAYGRVAQILRSVSWILERLPEPAEFLREAEARTLPDLFGGFRHRFATGREVASLLIGARELILRHGSLNAAFRTYHEPHAATVVPGLTGFVDELTNAAPVPLGHLVARPERGSACKRLHLMLRWLVRRDDVDPGGWEGVRPAQLVIPLDVHMDRICRSLGLTQRKQPNLATALEVTEGFRRICPEDPVRYDFVLTRLGIRGEMDADAFVRRHGLGFSG